MICGKILKQVAHSEGVIGAAAAVGGHNAGVYDLNKRCRCLCGGHQQPDVAAHVSLRAREQQLDEREDTRGVVKGEGGGGGRKWGGAWPEA